MKKRIFWSLLFAVSLLVTTSCSTSDDSDSSNNNNNNNSNDAAIAIQETTDAVTAGQWVITKFIDSEQDETNDFNGYTFTFNDDGSLVAVNGSNTVNGSWSVTDSSSDSSDDDGSSSDDIDFNIFFSTPSSFEELTEDWNILSRSTIKIELIHISGGNGGTDLLTFEKN